MLSCATYIFDNLDYGALSPNAYECVLNLVQKARGMYKDEEMFGVSNEIIRTVNEKKRLLTKNIKDNINEFYSNRIALLDLPPFYKEDDLYIVNNLCCHRILLDAMLNEAETTYYRDKDAILEVLNLIINVFNPEDSERLTNYIDDILRCLSDNNYLRTKDINYRRYLKRTMKNFKQLKRGKVKVITR